MLLRNLTRDQERALLETSGLSFSDIEVDSPNYELFDGLSKAGLVKLVGGGELRGVYLTPVGRKYVEVLKQRGAA